MAPIDVVVPQPSTSPRPPETPPSSPHLRAREQALNSEHVQLFVDLLKAAQSIQSAPAVAGAVQPASTGEISEDKKTSRARASKVEFKTVNGGVGLLRSVSLRKLRLLPCSWNEKEYKYKIVESTPSGEVDYLDEYIFVVRVRIGECVDPCTALRY